MKLFLIVFLLAVVCLAVAAGLAPPPGPPKPPGPPGPPIRTTTTTSTVRTTTTPVTTTTVRPIKTRKPKKTTATTTTTSQPTTSTTATTSTTRPSPTTTVNPTTTTTAPPTVTCTAVANSAISESPCGTCTPLSSTNGTIESLHFPNDYGVYFPNISYINCLYTITASPGRKIKLTFINKFVVDQNNDFITIYDGMAPNGTILADSLTGYVLPPAPFTTVTTNQMVVSFKTDKNNVGLPFRFRPAGWQANYTIVPISAATTTTKVASSSTLSTTTKTTPTPSGPILLNCTVYDPACGNVCTNVTSSGTGVVQSPNFPGDYGNKDRACVVIITAPVGWMIQLKFTTFNLETDVAYVDVHDDSVYLLSATTGNTIPALVPATINKMYITFQCSASTKPSTAIYNWQATFSVTSQGSSCSVDDPACGTMCTNVTSAGGVVQSGNFPGDYGNWDGNCGVTITTPAGWMIQLNFTTFNLETDKANVYVFADSVYLLPYTTGNTIPALVPTTTDAMEVGFLIGTSSKPSNAIYNWQATFSVSSQGSSCYVHDPAACGNMCTNATSAGTGVVQSPNFPADYGSDNMYCRVTVIVPAGKKIQLTFTTFNLETGKGLIKVFDRETNYLSRVNGVSGSTAPEAVTTRSNSVNMEFISSRSTKPNSAIYNWQATYTAA
ncbi:CUB and sushi domain-containing protein 2-like isoform X2 [Daphnia pulicaria]|uniref:CUB and sushi domain-containing protein 2-like isoform X2 n=1 Tax=Daphnia pulicaria TaxID=35523 RepID=UPI001EEC1F72|nr:CUB and sushi domain-containing protein 2-like isoform X2 [Daphnia pulicaria]